MEKFDDPGKTFEQTFAEGVRNGWNENVWALENYIT